MGYFKNLAILQEEADMGLLPTNEAIATHLQQIAHLFTKRKKDKADQHRAMSFSRAASQVRQGSDSIVDHQGNLKERIPGVGDTIADVIRQFVLTGTSDKMEKLKTELPNEVYERFDAKVCKRKVNELLAPLTEAGIDWGYAGSMRRGQPTVRDVDVIVCLKNEATERELVMRTLKRAGLSADVREGEQKVGVTIPIASQGRSFTLDLNFCYPENRGAYYLYYTGPKEMNVRMRAEAKAKGWLLNQYGLFDKNKKCLASKTELDMFVAMGWNFTSPEKRA